MARRRFQASFRRGRTLPAGDWAASNPALAISRGPRGTPPQTPGPAAAFPACSCPLPLSLPDEPGDPGTSFPVPPDCVGDTTKRLTAHTGLEPLDSSGSHRPAVRTSAEPPVREQPGRSPGDLGQPCHRAPFSAFEPFVLAAGPPHQVLVEPPQEVEQPGLVEAPVVVDPPLHDVVEHAGKVIEGLVTAPGQVPETGSSILRGK